jgi:hypothetical protein
MSTISGNTTRSKFRKKRSVATGAAPDAIEFHHNRLSGTGLGMLYEKTTDVLDGRARMKQIARNRLPN